MRKPACKNTMFGNRLAAENDAALVLNTMVNQEAWKIEAFQVGKVYEWGLVGPLFHIKRAVPEDGYYCEPFTTAGPGVEYWKAKTKHETASGAVAMLEEEIGKVIEEYQATIEEFLGVLEEIENAARRPYTCIIRSGSTIGRSIVWADDVESLADHINSTGDELLFAFDGDVENALAP